MFRKLDAAAVSTGRFLPTSQVLHQARREITDRLAASLGACLAAVRQATLAKLAEATGWPVSEVRLALRRLAEQLEAVDMHVLDDGSHVQPAPNKRFHGAVAQLRVRPRYV